jgi:hypothetical protein
VAGVPGVSTWVVLTSPTALLIKRSFAAQIATVWSIRPQRSLTASSFSDRLVPQAVIRAAVHTFATLAISACAEAEMLRQVWAGNRTLESHPERRLLGYRAHFT